MPPIIQHSDVDFLARLFKGLEIGDHVIGNTPGGFKIHAARGAGHESYAGFKPADHIVAANMHAKEARNLNIKATQLGGSATLKRQAANHLNIAAGHREMGSGAAQTKLAASMSGRGTDMRASGVYASVLAKAAGDRGGKVIGRTKSGHAIYESSSNAHYGRGKFADAHKHFTRQDHLDAEALHTKLAGNHGDDSRDADYAHGGMTGESGYRSSSSSKQSKANEAAGEHYRAAIFAKK